MANPNQIPGALPRDVNNVEIQITPNFLTSDANGQQSPITLPSGGSASVVVPAAAVSFIVLPVTSDLVISENLALSSANKGDLTTKGSKEQYPCAGMGAIFFQGTSGDVVYFRFEMLSIK